MVMVDVGLTVIVKFCIMISLVALTLNLISPETGHVGPTHGGVAKVKGPQSLLHESDSPLSQIPFPQQSDIGAEFWHAPASLHTSVVQLLPSLLSVENEGVVSFVSTYSVFLTSTARRIYHRGDAYHSLSTVQVTLGGGLLGSTHVPRFDLSFKLDE